MMTKRIKSETGFYSEAFKDWVGSLYMRGFSAAQIRDEAQARYPGQLNGLTRNAVIGIVSRSGMIRSRMVDRSPEGGTGHGRPAMITLAGPAWSIEALERPDVRKAAA